MDVKFSLLKPDDKDKLIPFIRRILKEGNSHTLGIYDKQYWEWQYEALPTKYSRTYIASLDNRIVGYYHVPVYEAKYNDTTVKLAAVQDVAVDQDTRGLGVFRKLSEFAEKDIAASDIDIIYTFPNKKSIHTFLKYNSYTYIKSLDTYISILNAAPLIRKKINIPLFDKIAGSIIDLYSRFRSAKKPKETDIQQHKEIDEKIERVFTEYNERKPISLIRSGGYLNWRYTSKPGVGHFIVSIKEKNIIQAVAIFKIDAILDSKALILMDFAFREKKDGLMLQLIQYFKDHNNKIIGEAYQLLLTSGNDPFLKELGRIGFIKVPQKVNPRRLNLLVKANDPKFKVTDPDQWRITFSDWDVL